MDAEGTAVASMTSTLKEVLKNAKDNSKVLAEMNGGIRCVYKAMEKRTGGIEEQRNTLEKTKLNK